MGGYVISGLSPITLPNGNQVKIPSVCTEVESKSFHVVEGMAQVIPLSIILTLPDYEYNIVYVGDDSEYTRAIDLGYLAVELKEPHEVLPEGINKRYFYNLGTDYKVNAVNIASMQETPDDPNSRVVYRVDIDDEEYSRVQSDGFEECLNPPTFLVELIFGKGGHHGSA